MKTRVTRKYLFDNYTHIICVGYCNLQTLLACASPIYYLTRSEGWAADVYYIDNNTVIVTGYAPVGNINPAYDFCLEYENAARAICDDWHEHNNYDLYAWNLSQLAADFAARCVLRDVFTKKQYENIERNLNSFIHNFGIPRIVRADYGSGFYVHYPANSDSYIQYCENIDYLDGWLYGVVQGFWRGEFKRGVKKDAC